MSHHFMFLSSFCSISPRLLLLVVVLIFWSTKVCEAKPINRLIDIAEKEKIDRLIENEKKRIALLEAKEELLMDVVETLDAEIKQETVRLEEMKSIGGRREMVENILEDYRKVFVSQQYRPG